MLDKVKLALRLSGTALDGEVSDLAKRGDCRSSPCRYQHSGGSGIVSKRWAIPSDRAVVLTQRRNLGFNDDAERYRNTYDYLKCALSLTADYIERSGGKNEMGRTNNLDCLIRTFAVNERTRLPPSPALKPRQRFFLLLTRNPWAFSEFYKAQQAGYTTELKFDVHSFEYEEQQIVEYPVSSGKRYRVLRTYTQERRIYGINAG